MTWEQTTLGALGKYLNGRAFKKDEWRDSGRPIVRIQNLTGSSKNFNYFQGEVEDRYVVRPGDLLVSWAATLGSYFWNGPEAVLNQHIFKVESRIDPKFHKYLLDFKLAELKEHAHGSGIVHITKGKFDSLPVEVPPFDEQRRIVAILEDHLSHLDAAEESLRGASRRLQALRAIVLADAHSGEAQALKDLAIDADYGTSTKCVVDGPGPAVVRIPNLVDGEIDLSDEKRVAGSDIDVTKSMLTEGDLLIVRTNGSVDLIGRSAVVGPEVKAAFASYLIRYKLDQRVVRPKWVQAMLSTPQLRSTIESIAASSAGQHNLSLAKLGPLQLPVPNIDTQDRILDRIDALDQDRRRLSMAISNAQARSFALRRSLLAAAFSGRLTGSAEGMSAVRETVGV